MIRWSNSNFSLVFLENAVHLGTNECWLEPLDWPDLETISQEQLDVDFMQQFVQQIYGNIAAEQFDAWADAAAGQQRK